MANKLTRRHSSWTESSKPLRRPLERIEGVTRIVSSIIVPCTVKRGRVKISSISGGVRLQILGSGAAHDLIVYTTGANVRDQIAAAIRKEKYELVEQI